MAQPLSNVDAAGLHMEAPTNLMMITGVVIFEQALDFARLKRTLEQRFSPFSSPSPTDRRKAASGWDRPNGSRSPPRHRQPCASDRAACARRPAALQALVSDLMEHARDYSKPLWQYHLIENYGGGSALIGRLHHCIGDGIALVRVMLSMTDDSPDAPWPPPHPEQQPPGCTPARDQARPRSHRHHPAVTGTLVRDSRIS